MRLPVIGGFPNKIIAPINRSRRHSPGGGTSRRGHVAAARGPVGHPRRRIPEAPEGQDKTGGECQRLILDKFSRSNKLLEELTVEQHARM